jgi:hypothetical protein
MDCKYDVVNPRLLTQLKDYSLTRSLVLSFTIQQKHCSAKLKDFEGGSSFEIFASSSEFLAKCRTIDNFDYTYTVDCLFPKSSDHIIQSDVTSTLINICMNISVVLHFEHLDGFADAGETEWASLSHAIFNDKLCGQTQSSSNTNGVTLTKLPEVDERYWESPTGDLGPGAAVAGKTQRSQRRGRHHSATHHSSSPFGDYVWSGSKNRYLKVI